MANGAAPANAAGQAAPTAQEVIDAAAAAAAAQLILDQAAQAAAAAAALLPPPAVIPPRDWDTLVAEASVEPHTIAHLLLQETNSTPWEEAMIPFTRFLSLTNDPTYQADAGQWSYADDISLNYFLTVIEDKWEVITGYRRCTPQHANGSRLSGLSGDRRMIHGMVTPPGLYTRAGALNVQSDLFMPIDAPALATVDVLGAVAADPTANWMDPDVGANAANIRGWPMLPIHPNIASLFLQGRSRFPPGTRDLVVDPSGVHKRTGIVGTTAAPGHHAHRSWYRHVRAHESMGTKGSVHQPRIDRLVLRVVGGD
jgi:hypothetical protein